MLRVCLQPTLTYSTAFLLTVSVTSDLLVHKILLWLGYPMLKKFRRYLFLTQLTNMTNTQTDRQTDRHCMTAYASLMHRIMRPKQCTSIVQRNFTKVDCSDNCGNLIFMCPRRARPVFRLDRSLVYFATISLRASQPYIRSESPFTDGRTLDTSLKLITSTVQATTSLNYQLYATT